MLSEPGYHPQSSVLSDTKIIRSKLCWRRVHNVNITVAARGPELKKVSLQKNAAYFAAVICVYV